VRGLLSLVDQAARDAALGRRQAYAVDKIGDGSRRFIHSGTVCIFSFTRNRAGLTSGNPGRAGGLVGCDYGELSWATG
jgi:hypothetical protein